MELGGVPFGVEPAQNPAKHFKPRHRHAGLLRPAQRFDKETLHLQRTSLFKINQGRRLVRPHLAGELDLFFSQ